MATVVRESLEQPSAANMKDEQARSAGEAQLRLLILEDQPHDADLIELELRRAGFKLQAIRLESEAEFLANLHEDLDIILSDFSMPSFDALRALDLLQQSGLDIPFIVVTGSFEREAIECMRRGAADYLQKDRLGRLVPAVQQAIQDNQMRREKRRVEQALHESEARFRGVAEAAVDALVVLDEHGLIGYCNPATEAIFGYRADQTVGQSPTVLLAEQEHERLRTSLAKLTESGSLPSPSRRGEFSGRRRDGSEFPMELALSFWELEGRNFIGASIRDLTETKQALEKAQLQDRLAAVGRLAAGIAHDFNNILGTITLYSELLMRSQDLPEAEQQRLKTMIQQSRRGANLVSQILDFSRRSVVQRHAMDLAPFLKDLTTLLSRTLPETIRIGLELGDDRYVIEADPTRLQQVIMNLSVNARDAMPDGGELRIVVDRFQLDDRSTPPFRGMPAGNWIRLRLIDTGSGIQSEDLPKVFEPFFTTKQPGAGTGLGLAQVYGLVKQHDGYIDVASEVGAGTTFTIYLPSSKRKSQQRSIEPGVSSPGAGETILLVEDDEATRHAVAEILNSLHYDVISSTTGRQALAIYERDPAGIDLVLSDLVMPDMGGAALFEELSRSHDGVKLLLMTGYPMEDQTRELLNRRRVDWIQKPFSSQIVAEKVRSLLARSA